ncbi:MAG: glycoside hydrolase family 3 N-terminal domain-containing protein [Pseudomonadota bacterium]
MPAACIFGCAGPELDPEEAAFFRDADPWGFIVFARNIKAPDQLRCLTGDLRDSVGRDAPVLIDQEGGRVARMTAPHWRRYPPALDQAASVRPADQARSFFLRGFLIGSELAAVGIDVNCTPLADIAEPATHPILRNRLYGETPDQVTANARALAEGQAAAGVLSVLKHLPGYGRAHVDSHLALPVVDAELSKLTGWDFAPFRALADMPLGMTAHIVLDAVDPGRAATVSQKVIDLIRRDIGFSGFLMTDDISMEALDGDVAARGTAALAAGCDAVLHCNGDRADMDLLMQVCPQLSPEGVERSDRADAARTSPAAIDIDAAASEFEALFAGRADD